LILEFGVREGGSGMIRERGKNARKRNKSSWRRWDDDEVCKPKILILQ
jgi:hypothetical protein